MSNYDPLSLQPQIFSILITMLLLLVICIIYYVKTRKLEVDKSPSGFVLVVQIYIMYFRNLVLEILGPKFEKITPFFVLLFTYILACNLIGIIGIESPTSSLTVTLSLALVSWVGIFVVGLKFQKLSFFKKYFFKVKISGKQVPIMINPLEIISTITPLISLSFRLWGNIFASSLILSLLFIATAFVWNYIPVIGVINLLGGFIAMPLHAYFDLLCGTIQALIFTMLTMIYWLLEANHGEQQSQKEVIKKFDVGKLDRTNINTN